MGNIEKADDTAFGLARRVFAESQYRPQNYMFGFLEDVARAIHTGKLDGISQEKARIVAMLEAEAAEWANASEAFHASGDFEAEDAANITTTVLRGTARKIGHTP